MSSAVLDPAVSAVNVAPELFNIVNRAVQQATQMCGIKVRCVGVLSVPPNEPGTVTGMIGVHGKVSGFITVNMSQRLAIRAVNGLLQEQETDLSAQVVDGVGEITNIISGGIKSSASVTPWAFSNITVPSVIVGRGYTIAYAKGLDFICALYEHDDPSCVMLEDRMMQVSISLLRL